MYNLFYYNINKMNDDVYCDELKKLPRLRREEIERKKDLNDRKRSLAGEIIVKKYISRLYNIPEDEIIIAKGEHGKPYALNVPAHFSVSHSGDFTVVAISNEPIGIDCEVIRDFSAIIAHKTFNTSERNYVAGNSANRTKSEMEKAFYEIWTAKEAYLKYTGQGLSGGINALSFEGDYNRLKPINQNIELIYDFSIPGAITAIVTAKKK